MGALIKHGPRNNDEIFSLPPSFLTMVRPLDPVVYPRLSAAQNGFFIETKDFTLCFENNARRDIKDLVFITRKGVTERYHLSVTKGSFGKYNGLEDLLKKVFKDNSLKANLLRHCRFKIDVNDRHLMSGGRVIASGFMSDNSELWSSSWHGNAWKKQIGEDFSYFVVDNFELTWVHKVVCQRRGQYQFLPNVALFFDTRDELVLKLINRPNDRDSCEGFYVGTLFGKPFGYHIDGLHNKIPSIDEYMSKAIEDIIHRPLEKGDLVTERFAVDAIYDRDEDRWSLHSTLGEICHMVKGVTPANTCDIRKHAAWTYTVFGEAIKNIPLLESLLIQAFHRAWMRPSARLQMEI